MFSFAGDNSESEEELDFSSATRNNSSGGLDNIFGRPSQSSSSNSKLVYQAPKQPSNNRGEMRNVEIVQEERLEVMSNVRSGVKMATAVSAYKYENTGYESLGKLGLAIIGKKESNCYQLLLYRGKQSAVAVANISPRINIRVQPDNYMSFVDEGGRSWTVCFDSQDVMINFVKQVLLCKAMFSKEEVVWCDLVLGEGREVEQGDSLEVQMTSWMVEHQSLDRMIETTRNKEKGIRFKLGGKNYFTDLESGILGMKKSGRRFIIAPSETGRRAYDVEIVKMKERRDHEASNNNINIMQELDHDTPAPRSAFSTPRSGRRGSGQRTTPIPIIRSESPAGSVRSGHSVTSGAAGPVRPAATVSGSAYTGASEFNMMMSETRLQNTEMRMNIQRISDKMDSLLNNHQQPRSSVGHENNNTQVLGKLDDIIKQNIELKHLLQTNQTVSSNICRDETQLEMLQSLEKKLKEKEEKLEREKRSMEERMMKLTQRLEEQEDMMNKSQHQQEIKKMMSSTAKVLLSQFNDDVSYDGETVKHTIQQTFQLIGDKLQQRYSDTARTRDPPPVAAVAPVPAEQEEWEAED